MVNALLAASLLPAAGGTVPTALIWTAIAVVLAGLAVVGVVAWRRRGRGPDDEADAAAAANDAGSDGSAH